MFTKLSQQSSKRFQPSNSLKVTTLLLTLVTFSCEDQPIGTVEAVAASDSNEAPAAPTSSSQAADATSSASDSTTSTLTSAIQNPVTVSSGPFCAGTGTLDNPFELCTLSDLEKIKNYSTNAFRLANDLNISATSFAAVATFSGIFDGAGHLLNLPAITSSSSSAFILNNSGTVKNLIITVNITGSGNVGGVIAENSGTLDNVLVLGSIRNNGVTSPNSGGLAAVNSGNIENSTSLVSISNTNFGNIGGAVGSNLTAGHLYNVSDILSSSAVSISASGTTGYIGLLVGYNSGVIELSYSGGSVTSATATGGIAGINVAGGTISKVYSGASITGSASNFDGFGGIVGVNEGNVDQAASEAPMHIAISDKPVGGIIGLNQGTGRISNSWSASNITATATIGGLIGKNISTYSPSVSTSYSVAQFTWGGPPGNINTGVGLANFGGLIGLSTGSITSSYHSRSSECFNGTHSTLHSYIIANCAASVSFGTLVSDSQLKSLTTFSGWDFTTIWMLSSGSYPELKWMH